MQIYGVIDVGDIGDIGDCGRSFRSIVDIFYFRYIGDIINDYGFDGRLNDFLNKIGVRSFVHYFPCICACIKYLVRKEKCIEKKKQRREAETN